jgi:3-oxoadipate enol-lactonase
MQTLQTRESLLDIARGVLDVRPLIDRLDQPVMVFPKAAGNGAPSGQPRDLAGFEKFLNRVATRVGAPPFKLCPDVTAAPRSALELAVSMRLLGEQTQVAGGRVVETSTEEDEIIEAALASSFESEFSQTKVESFDSSPLRAYTAGNPENKAVLLIPPCGMPAKLCERWMRLLAADYFVIIWETRLLFEEPANADSAAFDVKAQVSDLFAVMDHFGVITAHLMGLCGGAVMAVAAAAARTDRVCSLSLWHGDFELGPGTPKTKHQKDLKAFMQAAALGRVHADQIHKMFSQNNLKNFRSDWAHVVLYPYANSELLYRYARSNGNIMETNVTPLLPQVIQPTLVVTSQDDTTTHPDGSRRVADLLPNARLEIILHGDHLSLFHAGPDITQIAREFLAQDGFT